MMVIWIVIHDLNMHTTYGILLEMKNAYSEECKCTHPANKRSNEVIVIETFMLLKCYSEKVLSLRGEMKGAP